MTIEVLKIPETQDESLSLRYHHLEWLSGYTIAFSEEFGSPWTLENSTYLISETSDLFNSMATEEMVGSANKLSTKIFELFGGQYLHDVYGKSLGQTAGVTYKRGVYFSKVVFQIVTDQNGYLTLTDFPDGICGSCAIGKHCEEKYPKIFRPLGDSDFITKHSLLFLRRRKFSGVRKYENLIFEENGEVGVANKLLFDKNFYMDLTSEIRRRFLTAADFKYWNGLR